MTRYREALLVGAIRISANLLMIGALFVAMYFASRSYDSSMLVFCCWFFGITIPVWALALYLTKCVRRRADTANRSYVVLPGSDGPVLVEWKVCARPREPE